VRNGLHDDGIASLASALAIYAGVAGAWDAARLRAHGAHAY